LTSNFSISQYYHLRTKYSPETLAARSRALDFDQQPSTFKSYQIGRRIDLKPYLAPIPDDLGAGGAAGVAQETIADSGAGLDAPWAAGMPVLPDVSPQGPQFLYRLSQLLYCSYGLTQKLAYMGETFYLRAAPSAGGLYPAEIYLIVREDGVLSAGLYHYEVQTHSLVQFWQSHVWSTLEAGCLWHPALDNTHFALVVTSVFQRSFWRYEDRAYRRVFLDSGHLLGNIELAASLNCFRPHLIAGFVDAEVNQLLYLDLEQEGVIAVLALADLLKVEQNLPPTPTVIPSDIHRGYPKLAEGELLAYCHQATEIHNQEVTYPRLPPSSSEPEDKYNFPFCLKVSTQTTPIRWSSQSPSISLPQTLQPQLQGLVGTILKRRSTRQYNAAPLTLAELAATLDFAYHPEHYSDQGLDAAPDYCDLSLIETFVAVSGVMGLEAGCYYFAPKARELRQIRFKDFRPELYYLCLQQELGRDAGAVIFHTADLEKAVQRYGDRVYRYLHLDAGHLGQRLNLAAIHLGIGVSGIGGFFDDQVNELLGIPEAEAVLYITTLGRPS
jgi:SagB-type dehydrogenase family enzyme